METHHATHVRDLYPATGQARSVVAPEAGIEPALLILEINVQTITLHRYDGAHTTGSNLGHLSYKDSALPLSYEGVKDLDGARACAKRR